jgi:hypothetical protein
MVEDKTTLGHFIMAESVAVEQTVEGCRNRFQDDGACRAKERMNLGVKYHIC